MKVLTLGTWDLFHHGHYRLLERANQLGDLTIGVNTDTFVEQYKKRPPALHQARRISDLQVNGFTDIRLNDGPGIDLIREVQPDLLVIGSDWLGKDYPAQLGTTAQELADMHIGVLFLPRTPGISTTELRKAA